MDVWHVLTVLVRRWYVVAPLLLLTVLLMSRGTSTIQPEFQTQASVIFVRGQQESSANPYGSPGTAATAMKVVLESSDVRGRIGVTGPARAYEVTVPSRGSILNLRVRGRTQQEALTAGAQILDTLRQELEKRQAVALVAPPARTSLQSLDEPDTTVAQANGRRKVAAGILVAGGSAAVVAGVVVDEVAARRRRRRDLLVRARELDVLPGAPGGQEWARPPAGSSSGASSDWT